LIRANLFANVSLFLRKRLRWLTFWVDFFFLITSSEHTLEKNTVNQNIFVTKLEINPLVVFLKGFDNHPLGKKLKEKNFKFQGFYTSKTKCGLKKIVESGLIKTITNK